jgi:hypothetical protein
MELADLPGHPARGAASPLGLLGAGGVEARLAPLPDLGGVGGLPALTDTPATAPTVSLSVRG